MCACKRFTAKYAPINDRYRIVCVAERAAQTRPGRRVVNVKHVCEFSLFARISSTASIQLFSKPANEPLPSPLLLPLSSLSQPLPFISIAIIAVAVASHRNPNTGGTMMSTICGAVTGSDDAMRCDAMQAFRDMCAQSRVRA